MTCILSLPRFCLIRIIVCIGEGAYAEKPGDIDDLALPNGQVEVGRL